MHRRSCRCINILYGQLIEPNQKYLQYLKDEILKQVQLQPSINDKTSTCTNTQPYPIAA